MGYTQEPTTVGVMVFNIEEGGVGVDLAKVVEAIRLANPDIVGLEEAMGNTARIADELGWGSASARAHVLSRHPIVDPPEGDGVFVFVEVQPGRIVAVANIHLPSDPYGPRLAANGGSSEEVVALERRIRLPMLERSLAILPRLAAAGIPVFLLGDFNAPSHLDWTPASIGLRPHLRAAIDWPVSKAIGAVGFRDTWREIHPDPVAKPGLTWWAARPASVGYDPGPGEPKDRIDVIYAAGPSVTIDSRIVGEAGWPDVAVGVDPWPSDHRAVVATFRLSPAPMPVLVAVHRRLVTAGEALNVTWRRPGDAGERIGIEPGGTVHPIGGEGLSGTRDLATEGLSAGSYAVVLRDVAGTILSRAPFMVREPDDDVQLRTTQPIYRVGEAIAVGWTGGPGNRWDWIAVFRAPADDLRDAHLIWAHTAARIEGTVRLDASSAVVDQASIGGRWPLPPGDYEAAYLLDDSMERVARVAFTIVP